MVGDQFPPKKIKFDDIPWCISLFLNNYFFLRVVPELKFLIFRHRFQSFFSLGVGTLLDLQVLYDSLRLIHVEPAFLKQTKASKMLNRISN